jgi:hypothetical protein
MSGNFNKKQRKQAWQTSDTSGVSSQKQMPDRQKYEIEQFIQKQGITIDH